MRIITGSARGARLTTLEGDATRPTAERVKEGMFSAIQFDLHDRKVLEPFGGSGQLSLEALSRGAESAFICDESRDAVAVIKENAKKARLFERCSIIACDWKDCLRGAREKYSLVFLDPPYKEGVLDEILRRMFASDVLTDDAIIVCESDADGVPTPIDGAAAKIYRYGKTYVTIFRLGKEQ